MKSRKISLNIAVVALFLALIITFTYIPNLGFITIGPISFTTMHIIVLVAAIIFGKWIGLTIGTLFGIFSLIISISYPGTVNYLFVNPFVSVLPRIIFGYIAGAVFDYFRSRTSKANFLMVCAPLSGVLTLFHTFITLSCLYVFGYLDIFKISQAMGMMDIIQANEAAFGSFGNFIIAFIAPGTVCEAIVPIILVPSLAALYVYGKLPNNFYKLGVVNEIGVREKLLSKNILIVTIAALSTLVIGLCVAVLCLFYLN